MSNGSIDLIIKDARLIDGRVVDLGIAGGKIATLTEPGSNLTGQETIAAEGGLVTSSFVNGHMHLEKVYTLDLAGEDALNAYTSNDMSGALESIVENATKVKQHYDRSWIEPNVRKALDLAVLNGVLHIQAFVDVDTTSNLVGMEAVLAVREEYKDLIDIQVVAFPQDGVVRDPGAAELCEAAIAMGADVVGGIPWVESTDKDARAHIDWACSLAAKTGKRVAMLVDDAGDSSLRTTEMLGEAMIQYGLQGRGVACHARAVGLYPAPSVSRLSGLAKQAGLSFVSDPHTGPLALPVRRFVEAGLNVALGQDDIEDAYYPYGRHNMLEVAFLASHILQFLTADDQKLLIELITNRAAATLGITGHEIAVGSVANLCVHNSSRIIDLLREHEAPRFVIGKGKVRARTQISAEILR